MAFIESPRVKESTTTTGTGSLTLSGAAAGFQTFNAAVGTNNTCPYYLIDGNGIDWEMGIGTSTASNTFARTLILKSTNSNNAISLSANTHSIFLSALSDRINTGITPGGRLTLTSGTPVTAADVTGATSIYYCPYIHDKIPLWNGSAWIDTTFTETTLALGTLVSGAVYDVFAYLNAGALALEALIWKNGTATINIATPGDVTFTGGGVVNGDGVFFTTTGALPTGITAGTIYYARNVSGDTFQISANIGEVSINTSGSQSGTHTCYVVTKRGTDITLTDGKYTKSGDKTRLLLGSFCTTSTTTTEDSNQKRLLNNVYNGIDKSLKKSESTSSWAYTSTTWRSFNNSANNKVHIIQTLANQALNLIGKARSSNTTNNTISHLGIGYNSVVAVEPNSFVSSATGATTTAGRTMAAHYNGFLISGTIGDNIPKIGYHYFALLESALASGTNTFYGDGFSGLYGTWNC